MIVRKQVSNFSWVPQALERRVLIDASYLDMDPFFAIVLRSEGFFSLFHAVIATKCDFPLCFVLC